MLSRATIRYRAAVVLALGASSRSATRYIPREEGIFGKSRPTFLFWKQASQMSSSATIAATSCKEASTAAGLTCNPSLDPCDEIFEYAIFMHILIEWKIFMRARPKEYFCRIDDKIRHLARTPTAGGCPTDACIRTVPCITDLFVTRTSSFVIRIGLRNAVLMT